MPQLHTAPRPRPPLRYSKLHRELGWLEVVRGRWGFDGYWTRLVLPRRWSRFSLSLTVGPLTLHLYKARARPKSYPQLYAVDGGRPDDE